MDDEQNPRFSHIRIGSTDAPAGSSDEEEVITVGVVEEATTLDSPTALEVDAEEGLSEGDSARPKTGAGASEELPPMPIVQKIVLAACCVGLVVLVIFLVLYYL
ncbi:MAG: hypothetical protein LBS98_00825 [Coriobacteriales bacterium]|nr:hypothetical protein [Coriobacteriales bacterium]